MSQNRLPLLFSISLVFFPLKLGKSLAREKQRGEGEVLIDLVHFRVREFFFAPTYFANKFVAPGF
jgi:hypothetical protein